MAHLGVPTPAAAGSGNPLVKDGGADGAQVGAQSKAPVTARAGSRCLGPRLVCLRGLGPLVEGTSGVYRYAEYARRPSLSDFFGPATGSSLIVGGTRSEVLYLVSLVLTVVAGWMAWQSFRIANHGVQPRERGGLLAAGVGLPNPLVAFLTRLTREVNTDSLFVALAGVVVPAVAVSVLVITARTPVDGQTAAAHPGPAGPAGGPASDGRYYPVEPAPGHAAMAQPPGNAGYLSYVAPVAQASTNGLAIASMVLGILWIYWIGSVLALVFGYVAKAQIQRSMGRQSGRGMAIAGIVLGWIGLRGVCARGRVRVRGCRRLQQLRRGQQRSGRRCVYHARRLQDPDCSKDPPRLTAAIAIYARGADLPAVHRRRLVRPARPPWALRDRPKPLASRARLRRSFALFLGPFGVHKFSLGHVAVGVVASLLCWVVGLITAGVGELVMGVDFFIKGMIHLTKPYETSPETEALIGRFVTTTDPGSGFVEPYPRTIPAGPGGGATGCVDPPLG